MKSFATLPVISQLKSRRSAVSDHRRRQSCFPAFWVGISQGRVCRAASNQTPRLCSVNSPKCHHQGVTYLGPTPCLLAFLRERKVQAKPFHLILRYPKVQTASLECWNKVLRPTLLLCSRGVGTLSDVPCAVETTWIDPRSMSCTMFY